MKTIVNHGEQKKLKSDKWEEYSDRTLRRSPRPCGNQCYWGQKSYHRTGDTSIYNWQRHRMTIVHVVELE